MIVEILRTVMTADGLVVDRNNGKSYSGDEVDQAGIDYGNESSGEVWVWLKDFNKRENLVHGRYTQRAKRVALNHRDGSGAAQIDKNWMLVVHKSERSQILDRIGKKMVQSASAEHRWHWMFD